MRISIPLLSLLLVVMDASAQFRLPKKLPRIPGLEKIPGVDKILGSEPPVTTSLADALTEVAFLDNFTPELSLPLGSAPRKTEGTYALRPGFYRYEAQSYCLHAGTHGPGRGEGYLYAPLRGPRAPIIRNLLQRSVQHPEIHQHDLQLLIWSILARTKPGDMQPQLQRVAGQLLTPKELYDLNGGALGILPDSVKQQAFAKVPESVRKILEAENRIRELVTKTNATFDEVERVAVLAGDAPAQPGDRTDLPRQRWSYHPDGYFVRFDPHGYSRTIVDVYVPEWFQIVRDDAGRITRLSDRYGNRIETKYANSSASVRFIDGLNGKTVAKWDRAELAKPRKAGFKKPQLLNLAAYYDTVNALAGGDAKLARYPNLVLKAWQATFVQGGNPSMASAGAESPGDVGGGSADFDPSGNVAVPGQTARQRLAQSSRCGQECECDRDRTCRDIDAALNSIKSGAAQAQLSQQLDQLKKDFCKSPSADDVDQMQKDLQTMGYGDYALFRVKTALNDLKLRAGCGVPEFECPVTTNSTMMCPHGGRVVCTPSDANRAMPNGAPQLKATDNCIVMGCPFQINGQPSPCLRVQWIPSGGSLNLDCHSTGIVISANGVPQGPVTIIP